MTTIVSAFIHLTTNNNRTLESYIEQGSKLLNLNIYKIVFIDETVFHYFEKYKNEKTILIKTSIEDIYLYKYKEQLKYLELNTDNSAKDTFEYLIIQCNKTEWMREGIQLNPFESSQFIWIDFGIHHIFPEIINIKCIEKKYDKIRIPSIWCLGNFYDRDYKKDIMWYFAGGVFGGSISAIIQFANLMKRKCLMLIEIENHLMWEVNIWYLIWKNNAEIFDAYDADHNSSIIENY